MKANVPVILSSTAVRNNTRSKSECKVATDSVTSYNVEFRMPLWRKLGIALLIGFTLVVLVYAIFGSL